MGGELVAAETNGYGEISSQTGLDALDDLGVDAQAVLNTAAVFVGAVIIIGAEELVEQVAVTTGQLYAVKASLLGTDSGINEALFHDFDFLDRHLVGRGTTGSYRHLAGGPGLAGCGRGAFGAVVVQLDKAAAVVLVNGLGQGLEGGGVLVTSQRHLRIPGLIVHLVHIHTFDDNQAHAAPGTLFIIGDSLFAGITQVFAVHHLHGGQYSTVLDGQFTDLAGSKEFIHRAFLLK